MTQRRSGLPKALSHTFAIFCAKNRWPCALRRRHRTRLSLSLALRVSSRELAARSTPLVRISPVCARKAAAWDAGTYVRVQAPKRGIAF